MGQEIFLDTPCCSPKSRLTPIDLSIVIVNYRSKEKVRVCLDSIIKFNRPDFNYEIVLVENNSGDDLTDLVKLESRIKLIISPKNLGPGNGNNLGIDRAEGEYILILNPDTRVEDGAIITLLNYLKNNKEVGIVGPKQINPHGYIQRSCLNFPSIFMPILRRTSLGRYFVPVVARFQMEDFGHDSIKEVDWLAGSALMFKKRLVLPDGNEYCPCFDDRYFMYFEDTDICRNIWAKGLKVVYNPEAVIDHECVRQSARYPWYQAIFRDFSARAHIISYFKYFLKWGLNNSRTI